MDRLLTRIRELGKVAVALSGGLDSSTLLKLCAETLGAENCLAVTASTPYMMASEHGEAMKLCADIGVEYVEIKLDTPQCIADNPQDRCYLCKREIFSRLIALTQSRGFENVLDGTNADDTSDYRPGMRALKEFGVKSPFLECGIGKAQIRAAAQKYSLSVASKPAYACLMTRLEHGAVADEKLFARIDESENFLRSRGFDSVRVRVHSQCARIEVEASRLVEFCDADNMKAVYEKLKSLGFKYVSVDLCGYSRGGMNESKK